MGRVKKEPQSNTDKVTTKVEDVKYVETQKQDEHSIDQVVNHVLNDVVKNEEKDERISALEDLIKNLQLEQANTTNKIISIGEQIRQLQAQINITKVQDHPTVKRIAQLKYPPVREHQSGIYHDTDLGTWG